MRCLPLAILLIVLAGCGGTAARPVASATATSTAPPAATKAPAPAVTPAPMPAGPWSAPVAGPRHPPRCPISSSQGRWPSRVLALGGDTYVKLSAGRTPRLAEVDADGKPLRQTDLGGRPAETVALACGRGGRLAAAWVEYRGDMGYGLLVVMRSPAGRLSQPKTVARAQESLDDRGANDLALAFAPDGGLLVAYSVDRQVRAVRVSGSGAAGTSVKVGPASNITQLAAAIGSEGRAVVAWSTFDGGIEQGVPRRIYAATQAPGAPSFAPAALVHQASGTNEFAYDEPGIRLAVAPNGHALLMWRSENGVWPHDHHPTMLAHAAPSGGFGELKELATDGIPGDVAIRSDGSLLAVWRSNGRLKALVIGQSETITGPNPTDDPVASFTDGHPRVEWEGASSVRAKP